MTDTVQGGTNSFARVPFTNVGFEIVMTRPASSRALTLPLFHVQAQSYPTEPPAAFRYNDMLL